MKKTQVHIIRMNKACLGGLENSALLYVTLLNALHVLLHYWMH